MKSTICWSYRYIELNPVRAEMVKDPDGYRWSNYQINALDKNSELCTPHPLYAALGSSSKDRQEKYRNVFVHHIDGELLTQIRTNTNKGMVVGNDRFREEIELLTGRRVKPQKRGRPIGWRKTGK